MKRSLPIFLLVLALFALTACAPAAGQDVAVIGGADGPTEILISDEPAAQDTQDAAAAPDAAEAPEAAELSDEAAAALTDILSEIEEGYYPGTAGCSLSAARLCAMLLDWYAAYRPEGEDITRVTAAYYAVLEDEAAVLFADEQLPGVCAETELLLAENSTELLESAGYTPASYPWSAEDAQQLTDALIAGIG